jgi:hypothetical protein
MAYMAGVRAAVVAVLEGNVGDRDVWAFPHEPDQLLRDAVIVAPVRLSPPTVATAGATVAEVELWVVSATTLDEASEDDLEDFLGDVLGVIDAAGLDWQRAERAVWDETHPAYRIEMEYMS